MSIHDFDQTVPARAPEPRPDHPTIGLRHECERCGVPYYQHPLLSIESGDRMLAVPGVSDAYYAECLAFALDPDGTR